MGKVKEPAEVVKKRIVEVATQLFAQEGVEGVGLRKIAAVAGINHAMIIRYYGSKEALVTEILHQRILDITSMPQATPPEDMESALLNLKNIIRTNLNDDITMKLIIRASLDGLKPESYLKEGFPRASTLLVQWMKTGQKGSDLPDARMIAVILTGAMFSLTAQSPWLLSSVGLEPDSFEAYKEELVDAMVWIVKKTMGM